jgi:hemoglobin
MAINFGETAMFRERRLAWLAMLVGAAMALFASAAVAADQEGDDKRFEKNLEVGLRDVINRGAAIFNNQGDYRGCYRLYQGALMTIKPVLTNYPMLQKQIEDGLANAYTLARMHDRAHALRRVLDDVRFTINPAARPAPKTLWERLGGEAGVNKVISDLIAAAAKDPKVNFDRNGKYPFDMAKLDKLQKSLVDFVSSATGGPFQYKGPSMKEVHKGMGITNEQFDALAGHLKKALEKNNVKADDVTAIMNAVEGTRKDIVETRAKKLATTQGGDKKKQEPPDPNMARVHGKVLINDQPLTHGFVTFVGPTGRQFSANILKDGTFAFRKGFPPGEYKVIMEDSPTPPAPDEKRLAIPKAFQDVVTSSLRYTAAKGESRFDIRLK